MFPLVSLPDGQAQLVVLLAIAGCMLCFWGMAWSALRRGKMGGAVVVFWAAFFGLVACLLLVFGVEVRR